MNIDISSLSAKELYELARQKEMEEERQAELNEHLHKLEAQREQLSGKFQKTLSTIDNEIKQLQQQRERLVSDHELELSRLNDEIENTSKQTGSTPASKIKAYNTPSTLAVTESAEQGLSSSQGEIEPLAAQPTNPSPNPINEGESLYEIVSELMRSREYISETLLKEKLKVMGYPSQNIGKDLDRLVKEKRLIRKSGGSYVLGKQ